MELAHRTSNGPYCSTPCEKPTCCTRGGICVCSWPDTEENRQTSSQLQKAVSEGVTDRPSSSCISREHCSITGPRISLLKLGKVEECTSAQVSHKPCPVLSYLEASSSLPDIWPSADQQILSIRTSTDSQARETGQYSDLCSNQGVHLPDPSSEACFIGTSLVSSARLSPTAAQVTAKMLQPVGPPPGHLIFFHAVTSGQNNVELGGDERDAVMMAYSIYDLDNRKMMTLQHKYVRPESDSPGSDCLLTEECKKETNIEEDWVRNEQQFAGVLDEIDRFLRTRFTQSEDGSFPFRLMTLGPNHLRLVTHSEAIRKNVTLPSYYYRYYDLLKEFRRVYNGMDASNLGDMLDYLGMEPSLGLEYGIRHVTDMRRVVDRMVVEGHQFATGEIIKDKLESGICSKTDYVDDNTVIKARGLPWQSSDHDVGKFFKGLNISRGGVALCLSPQGRRNGEALVRFESHESRDLALKKHKHHLADRYIEVYPATGRDFLNIAGGTSKDAQAFLSLGGDAIMRMRGLPYTASADQVIEFFEKDNGPPVYRGSEGILFVRQPDKRATGDAFVLFETTEDSAKAIERHRCCIGTRYIELFHSTVAEVQQVLNRTLEPPPPQIDPMMSQSSLMAPHYAQGALTHPHAAALAAQQQAAIGLLPLGPPPPTDLSMGAMVPAMSNSFQSMVGSSTIKNCIRLRGLPFEASVKEIIAFLGDHARNIIVQGVHMVYNAQGSPSGEAFIQMDTEYAAEATSISRHKKIMSQPTGKKRYIEVFQCSGADMNLVLAGEAPSTISASGLLPGLAAPTMPAPMTIPIMQRPQIMAAGFSAAGQHNGNGSINPYANGAHGLASAGYPFAGTPTAAMQMPPPVSHSQLTAAAAASSAQTNAAMAAAAAAAGYPQLATNPTASHMAAIAALNPPASMAGFPGMGAAARGQYPPLFYHYYPSPPISPHTVYGSQAAIAAAAAAGMPTSQTLVLVKGLPSIVHREEILLFFAGFYELTMDSIQIQRGPDGHCRGDAVIQFMTRAEAERAVGENNGKVLGGRIVNLYICG